VDPGGRKHFRCLAQFKVAQTTANAVAVAGDADLEIMIDPKRVALRETATKFIDAAAARGSMEASEIYKRTLNDFLRECTKIYADELAHDDVLKFHASMRKWGLADRTVSS
jgi:hypothetical protein